MNSVKIIAWIVPFILLGYAHSEATTQTNPQAITFKALENYLRTANPEKRIQVMAAKGASEILATRIYNAFELSANKLASKIDDLRNQRDAAWGELHRNPELTITLLWPIVKENAGKKAELTDVYVIPPEEKISLYISLCLNFALTEDGTFAYNKLLELSHHQDKIIADYAKSELEIYSKSNWKILSESYKREGRADDLNPGGHAKSHGCGHLKIPPLSA